MKLRIAAIASAFALTAAGVNVATTTPSSATVTPDPTPTPTATATADPTEPPTPFDEIVYTFASAPDLFNADIGDVTHRAGWDPGDGNSMNSYWRDAITRVFGDIVRQQPDSIFVAGDLVEGHWGVDVDNTRIFGPTGTYNEKVDAVHAAGNTYYKAWKTFWAQNNFSPSDVYPAVGDHEIGDNEWPVNEFKFKAFSEFKDTWSDNFTTSFDTAEKYPMHPVGTDFDETAYAKWVAPSVLLVTVDVFNKKSDGVRATVTGGQLDWLERVLSTTTPADTVIVQGHTPVLTPVRTYGSSGLIMEGGASSRFWQTLNAHKVDFYFAGEVHDNTARQSDYTVQISHGGLIKNTRTKYLVGTVYASGKVEIETRSFTGTYEQYPQMWQTDNRRPPAKIIFDGPSSVSGAMTVVNGTASDTSGDMIVNPAVVTRKRMAAGITESGD